MFDLKDIKSANLTPSFDFKGFFIKLLAYWYLFVIVMGITLFWAYKTNIKKEDQYGMQSSIMIKDENNPLFTNNTSLIFDWGGTSDKIQTIISIIKSRTHNENVVDYLEYYIQYLKKGEYYYSDIYGNTPFKVQINKAKGQLYGIPIKITVLNSIQYKLEVDFSENPNVNLYDYLLYKSYPITVNKSLFSKVYSFNENVNLPFFNGQLKLIAPEKIVPNEDIYIRFDDFNGTVSAYQGIKVEADLKSQSIVMLDLQGPNKNRLVEYLNTTVYILKDNELKRKNLFAVNTIRFIDSTLMDLEKQLKNSEDDLKKIKSSEDFYKIQSETAGSTEKLTALDEKNESLKRKIEYYDLLKKYLLNNSDYSKLPAPAIAGIDDPNVISKVSELIGLSVERSESSFKVKNPKMFAEIDSKMESLKRVLLNNIESAKVAIEIEFRVVNKELKEEEMSLRSLPQKQQDFINFTRKYDLKEKIFNTFLEKRSEADIVKASNVSDIEFLDQAKDVGGGFRGPNKSINYVLALILGFSLPLVYVIILTLLDTNINNTSEIEKLTTIPIIGIIGKKNTVSNLSVFEKPRSPLAESFRAIRSSLQYIYKKQDYDGSKVLMITSSISGEGKSFCSMNLATVFALSGKKTILVGLDLRKPRIFDDFKFNNAYGVVNYLVGNKNIDEILVNTHIPNLDLISSGPIPPNPSELLMNDNMEQLINVLKKDYDFIILDTPPVGLVTDALDLAKFADATVYVVRQAYTKRGMLNVVKEKHNRGELKNISILFNGFENKAKYGYGYGYGGYGYGAYSYGNYFDEENRKPKTIKEKIIHYINKLRK